MVRFVLSAFADEAASRLDEQLRILKEEGVPLLELRGADGKNCADLTLEEAAVIRKKLDEAGIELSALGSPFGKYPMAEPFEAHLAKFRHGLELCRVLRCSRIRMFSFFPDAGMTEEENRQEAYARLAVMLDEAEAAGVQLVHENEKGIWGDTAERNAELLAHFGGRLGFAFDPANFVQCGVDTVRAFDLLHDRITYMHIKDALKEDGAVVRAGRGDGHVPEILRQLAAERDGEIVLTVEPHLTVFAGLQQLQDEELLHHERYADSRTAFHAAVSALKEILAQL